MKKNSFKTNISEIKKVSQRIPKTINEAINFNEIENDEFDDGIEDEYDEEPSVETTVEQPVKNEDGLVVAKFYSLLDKSLVSFRSSKTTRVLTDEQRKAMSERLKSMRGKKNENL